MSERERLGASGGSAYTPSHMPAGAGETANQMTARCLIGPCRTFRERSVE